MHAFLTYFICLSFILIWLVNNNFPIDNSHFLFLFLSLIFLFRWAGSRKGEVQSHLRRIGSNLRWDVRLLIFHPVQYFLLPCFGDFLPTFGGFFSIFGRFPNKFLMNFHRFINEFASSYLFKFVILAKLNILPDWRIFKSLPRYLLFFDSIHNLSVVPIVDFFNQAHDNGHGSEVLTNCILPPLKASPSRNPGGEISSIKPVVRLCLSIVAYLLDIYSWRGGSTYPRAGSRLMSSWECLFMHRLWAVWNVDEIYVVLILIYYQY